MTMYDDVRNTEANINSSPYTYPQQTSYIWPATGGITVTREEFEYSIKIKERYNTLMALYREGGAHALEEIIDAWHSEPTVTSG